MKNIVILTGAGISAQSGIKTFRDSNGLWENHDVMEVASIDGWHKNPELVLNFYNERRKQAETVEPNAAHFFLAALQKKYAVQIITQNVDDLHERAGSRNIIHLHGKLSEAKSTINNNYILDVSNQKIKLGDTCPKGYQLRPNIIWFGEEVPLLETAAKICETATVFVIIGTSLQVYPAAGLIDRIPKKCPVFIIDPHVDEINIPSRYITLKTSAIKGVQLLDTYLKEMD